MRSQWFKSQVSFSGGICEDKIWKCQFAVKWGSAQKWSPTQEDIEGERNGSDKKMEEMGGVFAAFCGADGGRKPDGAGGNAEHDGFSR